MKIDWYKHYLQKEKRVLSKERLKESVTQDKPFLRVLKKFVPPPANVLEAGCGLGRTCLSMALNGYRVTGIDRDSRMLSLARKHAKNVSQKIAYKKFNIFHLDTRFKKNAFDCITHQGVLEHYPVAKIRKALHVQLEVSPLVIFSVPINSVYNRNYFHDRIYRNLWSPNFWLKNILKRYNVVYHTVVRDRKDSFVVVLK